MEAAPPILKEGPVDSVNTEFFTLQTNKVDQFLALRGAACLIVLLGHAFMRMRTLMDPLIIGGVDLTWLLRPNAAMGMYVFFTLSGYLMGNQFFSGKYTVSRQGICSFFRARAMRIAPLFYALTLFYLIYDGVDFLRDFHPNQLLKILTFTFSIWPFDYAGEHFWSIATEMQFYLTVPALFFICKRFCKNGYFLTASLVCVLVCLEYYRVQTYFKCLYPNGALNMTLYHKKIYYPLIGNLDAFFIGFWLNMFYEWLGNSNSSQNISKVKRFFAGLVERLKGPRSAKSALSLLFIAWSTILLSCVVIARFQANDQMELMALQTGVINLMTAAATAVFIIIAHGAENNIKNARLNLDSCWKNPFRLLECIGVLSYGIYLWHISIMAFLAMIIIRTNSFHEYLLLIFSTTAVTILFATVTYIGIEKPINQMRYKLSDK